MFQVQRSSFRYWRKRPIHIRPERLRLIAQLKRWFGISHGSAGQRTLVQLLNDSGFKVSRWLVRKLTPVRDKNLLYEGTNCLFQDQIF